MKRPVFVFALSCMICLTACDGMLQPSEFDIAEAIGCYSNGNGVSIKISAQEVTSSDLKTWVSKSYEIRGQKYIEMEDKIILNEPENVIEIAELGRAHRFAFESDGSRKRIKISNDRNRVSTLKWAPCIDFGAQ